REFVEPQPVRSVLDRRRTGGIAGAAALMNVQLMGINNKHASGNRERGSVLIEFAISSTLLFLFFFGIVNFARMFTAAEVVADAAAAGTQYGALSPAHYGDFTGMQNAAQADAANAPGLTATASQFCTCSIGGAHTSCLAT